ncbi:hypothetical protein GJ496_004920 [Pomphorhynchus laevis]|nr:hypothetical protein GJ496_004920 [Pomphorhynchus laevis]
MLIKTVNLKRIRKRGYSVIILLQYTSKFKFIASVDDTLLSSMYFFGSEQHMFDFTFKPLATKWVELNIAKSLLLQPSAISEMIPDLIKSINDAYLCGWTARAPKYLTIKLISNQDRVKDMTFNKLDYDDLGYERHATYNVLDAILKIGGFTRLIECLYNVYDQYPVNVDIQHSMLIFVFDTIVKSPLLFEQYENMGGWKLIMFIISNASDIHSKGIDYAIMRFGSLLSNISVDRCELDYDNLTLAYTDPWNYLISNCNQSTSRCVMLQKALTTILCNSTRSLRQSYNAERFFSSKLFHIMIHRIEKNIFFNVKTKIKFDVNFLLTFLKTVRCEYLNKAKLTFSLYKLLVCWHNYYGYQKDVYMAAKEIFLYEDVNTTLSTSQNRAEAKQKFQFETSRRRSKSLLDPNNVLRKFNYEELDDCTDDLKLLFSEIARLFTKCVEKMNPEERCNFFKKSDFTLVTLLSSCFDSELLDSLLKINIQFLEYSYSTADQLYIVQKCRYCILITAFLLGQCQSISSDSVDYCISQVNTSDLSNYEDSNGFKMIFLIFLIAFIPSMKNYETDLVKILDTLNQLIWTNHNAHLFIINHGIINALNATLVKYGILTKTIEFYYDISAILFCCPSNTYSHEWLMAMYTDLVLKESTILTEEAISTVQFSIVNSVFDVINFAYSGQIVIQSIGKGHKCTERNKNRISNLLELEKINSKALSYRLLMFLESCLPMLTASLKNVKSIFIDSNKSPHCLLTINCNILIDAIDLYINVSIVG